MHSVLKWGLFVFIYSSMVPHIFITGHVYFLRLFQKTTNFIWVRNYYLKNFGNTNKVYALEETNPSLLKLFSYYKFLSSRILAQELYEKGKITEKVHKNLQSSDIFTRKDSLLSDILTDLFSIDQFQNNESSSDPKKSIFDVISTHRDNDIMKSDIENKARIDFYVFLPQTSIIFLSLFSGYLPAILIKIIGLISSLCFYYAYIVLQQEIIGKILICFPMYLILATSTNLMDFVSEKSHNNKVIAHILYNSGINLSAVTPYIYVLLIKFKYSKIVDYFQITKTYLFCLLLFALAGLTLEFFFVHPTHPNQISTKYIILPIEKKESRKDIDRVDQLDSFFNRFRQYKPQDSSSLVDYKLYTKEDSIEKNSFEEDTKIINLEHIFEEDCRDNDEYNNAEVYESKDFIDSTEKDIINFNLFLIIVSIKYFAVYFLIFMTTNLISHINRLNVKSIGLNTTIIISQIICACFNYPLTYIFVLFGLRTAPLIVGIIGSFAAYIMIFAINYYYNHKIINVTKESLTKTSDILILILMQLLIDSINLASLKLFLIDCLKSPNPDKHEILIKFIVAILALFSIYSIELFSNHKLYKIFFSILVSLHLISTMLEIVFSMGFINEKWYIIRVTNSSSIKGQPTNDFSYQDQIAVTFDSPKTNSSIEEFSFYNKFDNQKNHEIGQNQISESNNNSFTQNSQNIILNRESKEALLNQDFDDKKLNKNHDSSGNLNNFSFSHLMHKYRK